MLRPSAPIRRKLSMLTLVTCGIALLVTTVLFLAGELLVIRRSNLQQLQTLSEAIASNCTAALAFDNPEDAGNVLSAFRSDPHIEVAGLYKADGTLFATYPPSAALQQLPERAVAPGYRFSGGTLIGVSE